MCSDCVDEAGDTPRDDEDDEAVSAIAEVPAAIDDPWDRATDGERFPWRLWSIGVTTWVTFEPTESVLSSSYMLYRLYHTFFCGLIIFTRPQ